MADSPQTASAGATQPPYLKHVHLRNVPPLRDVTADFKPGLNVIIGKNGSGKTRAMKLIKELVEMFEEKHSGVGSEIVIGGKEDVKISFKEQLVSKDSQRPFLSKAMVNQLALIAVAVSLVINKTKIEENEVLEEAMYRVTKDHQLHFVVPIWHGIPTLPLIDTSADFSITKAGSPTLMNTNLEWWKVDSQLLSALFRTFDEIRWDEIIGTNSDADSQLHTARQRISSAADSHVARLNVYLPLYSPLEAVRRSDQFQVYYNSGNEEIIVKGLVLEYKIAGDWLPFSALSDGTKRLLFIIGELTASFVAYWHGKDFQLNDEGFNKIILLEEPELGIHPDQLQLLLQLIREVSREHQVIMTTHSPQTLDILNRDELDRISICEYVPGKGTQMRQLSAAKQAKARAYLRDEGFLSEFWRFSNLEDPD
ncbi:AAA family ATPase [Hymenobacter sp. ASUV-10]|uniref:AAA family ATPase n=1 Tax=Hymenobacter aranciens TaxID=3063996 RepID=A0ABT9B6Z3_9BACT|nr:ATP-binding protein [Hymenobacter sp. ASUV-10]MDO7874049.1 AAA family ATPase [Hymenobacter sp. ASUV-10]